MMSDARTNQLAEVWRVALARRGGQTDASLRETEGPLSLGSLNMYLQSVKEMLRGGQYTRALKNDDTEYFLTRIERELGGPELRLALKAIDQHIKYYNALEKGELRGARDVHDRWMKRLGHGANPAKTEAGRNTPSTLAAYLAQEYAALATALARTPADRAARLAAADPMPKTATVTATVYLRNPDVRATVLLRANGTCEGCTKPAPFFKRSDGTPFLEVHHRIPLAEKGRDTVANAIALCPNCHREAHHGVYAEKFRA